MQVAAKMLPMKFVIVEITNENDALEANVSASESRLRPGRRSTRCLTILPDNDDSRAKSTER